jgi:sugar O-acyltransferase (sialic acid O-acetyltransferase NeuD family)
VKVLILGAGGFARELYWYVKDKERDAEVAFFDDVNGRRSLAIGGREVRVVASTDELAALGAGWGFLMGVGTPGAKRTLLEKAARARLAPLPTLVHPLAYVADARLGVGGAVAPGARITTNIVVGDHVLVGVNATIGHDTTIGDCSTLNPGCQVSGNVTVGPDVLIGTGAAVREKVAIAASVVVGAQACVVRDLTEPGTYVGVPCRRLPTP